MRVLVVEDSPSLQRSLSQALREAGFAVDAVGDGKQGLIHARTTEYDVIVLDIMLPEMDGLTVLRKLRERNVPAAVLLLTARDTVEQRVTGLRAGADDYLVKPFALAELLARVQALARRVHGVRGSDIRVGVLRVDTAAKIVTVLSPRASRLDLAPREYALLEYLAHRAGKPVSRAELEEHLYDDASRVNSNAVDVAVATLRAKLAHAGCPKLIHTRRKLGYVLSEEEP